MKLITYRNINFFQSNLLRKHNFNHGFFTRREKNNYPEYLQTGLNLTSNIHYLKQVHSNKVIQVSNTLDVEPQTGDCLITKKSNQSLWIYTADCIPIIIADKKTRSIAACHAGLKGIKNKIISKTLNELKGIGSKKDNLIIAIGPAIQGDKYQVNTKDVKDLIFQITEENFIGKGSFHIKWDKEELIELYKEDSKPGRLLFDLKAAAVLQFYKEGIKKNQINLNTLCTYSNPKLFNSFRRDSTNSRQWSCIYS